jgi:hypothetical protein
MGASSQTLATTITQVRSIIDEPDSTYTTYWQDTELTTWINEGCRDIQRRGEIIENILTQPVNVNQQIFPAPPDVLRIYRIEFEPTTPGTSFPEVYNLEFRGYNEMDRIWGIFQNYPASYPLYYTITPTWPNLNVVVYPVAGQAGFLRIFYYRQTLNAAIPATDTIDVMPGYEDVVVDYAAYRAFRKDASPRWKDQFTIYEDKLMAMIDKTRLFTDQGNYFSTGQQALPTWLTGGYGELY